MRILIILLVVGLSLVTAKYIPHESQDGNSLLNRVRRSDSDDSDSNAASAERNDDPCNDNDHSNGDDNDSLEEITKEQDKHREREEKKKQKLLEKLEKQKLKEIEEQRKLEEKLAKEKRKEEERKEKEEKRLAEKIEKENKKFEEEKRKMEEKEEKKRQDKLKKQLKEIHKEQLESAEDTYLETEEEDSVEIEDIWKTYVYDKYGITIMSTKLERQAVLQRYLQEEMGITANSTKSERREAILKLIQTKLQNDTTAVDSFRNILISHVNAAQIQKLRTKLENDLEELDNQTKLLNNISPPLISVTQQNIQEKRTFLQTIAQFLSNIVPNWSTDGQFLNNSIQLDSSDTVNASIVSNVVSSNGQSSQSIATTDNGALNNGVACGESNTNGLSSNSGTPSSNPSEPNGTMGGDSLNANVPISQTVINGPPSNSANVDSPILSGPTVSTDNTSEPNVSGGNDLLNGNTLTSETNSNGLPSTQSTASNSQASNTPVRPEISSSNPLVPNGGNDFGNNNIPVIPTDTNGLPTNTDTNAAETNISTSLDSEKIQNNLLDSNGSTGTSINNNVLAGQNDATDRPSNTASTIDMDSSNASTSGSGLSSNNPPAANGPVNSGSLNNKDLVADTNADAQSSAIENSLNLDLNNPIGPTGTETSQTNDNVAQSGIINSPNSASPSTTAPSDSESNIDNIPHTNGFVGSIPSSNGVSISQTDVNGLTSNTNNAVTVDLSNVQEPITVGEADINGESSISNSLNSDSSNTVVTSDSATNIGSIPGANVPVGSISSSNNVASSQTNVDGLPSNTYSTINIDSLNVQESIGSTTSPNAPSDDAITTDAVDTFIGNDPLNYVTTDQIGIVTIPSEINLASLSETSNTTPSNGSEQILNNPPISTISGDNVVGNNDNSSTFDSENGAFIQYSNGNVTEPLVSENSENIFTVAVTGGNNYDETTNNTVNDGNVSPININGIPQTNDFPVLGSTDVSTNVNSELTGTTVNSIVIDDFSTTSKTESLILTNESMKGEIAPAKDDIVSIPVTSDVALGDSDPASSGALSNSNGVDDINVVSAINDQSLSNFGSNISSTAATVNEVVSTNSETVTDGSGTINEVVYQGSASQNTSVSNAEGTTSIVLDAQDSNIVPITTEAVGTNVLETRIETHTEQSIVQEIVNTPSESVTAASSQSSLPNLDVNLPNESAASIVDIMLQ